MDKINAPNDQADREICRRTFNHDAKLYDSARPGYPKDLFADIIHLANLPEKALILEIGCGTGQATLPFARKNFSIHGLELGGNLAAIARQNLSDYPNAQITTGAFEKIPLKPAHYDLVISATAFHWIDPAYRYTKTAAILKPGGGLALFWNKHVQSVLSADFFHAVQNVYKAAAPEMAKSNPGLPIPENIPTPYKREIENSNFFGSVTILKYPWTVQYDSASYIQLLNTYSDHIALAPQKRQALFDGITNLMVTRFDGSIQKEYLTLLYFARRKQRV